jgi:hypothetical protein
MSTQDLDQLRIDYKNAVDKWVDTIRAEESLATPDHSMTAMERWDDAHFRQSDKGARSLQRRPTQRQLRHLIAPLLIQNG